MTTYYSCPHLPTCSRNIKYNKKPCAQHSRLNITRVKAHTLNRKIHGNCGPDCPTYKLDAQGVDIMNFQPFPFDNSPRSSAVLSRSRGLVPDTLEKSSQAVEIIPSDPSSRASAVPSRYTTDEIITNNLKGLVSDDVQKSCMLAGFHFLLRVIAYGSLVGTWSRSFFSLHLANPDPKYEYMCDLAHACNFAPVCYFFSGWKHAKHSALLLYSFLPIHTPPPPDSEGGNVMICAGSRCGARFFLVHLYMYWVPISCRDDYDVLPKSDLQCTFFLLKLERLSVFSLYPPHVLQLFRASRNINRICIKLAVIESEDLEDFMDRDDPFWISLISLFIFTLKTR
ncbi:hypothetical protein PSHT_16428 [Puccinia striiformis]|uniref:Uncharacterized protein n=1 Tax=Puccinia striiformis TaxID=27350 RepID=A0A2S4UA09_9BASI|nr:hypothetical protein PSHT_16428 [Puccinia striiformis]